MITNQLALRRLVALATQQPDSKYVTSVAATTLICDEPAQRDLRLPGNVSARPAGGLVDHSRRTGLPAFGGLRRLSQHLVNVRSSRTGTRSRGPDRRLPGVAPGHSHGVAARPPRPWRPEAY